MKCFFCFLLMCFFSFFILLANTSAHKQQLLCNTPVNLNTISIDANTEQLLWDLVSNVSYYNVRYRAVGDAEWNGIWTNSNVVNLNNLRDATNYEWQVQSACTDNNASVFSQSNTFISQNNSTNDTISLARVVYLQKGTPNSLTFRWRTNQKTSTAVYYGSSPKTLTAWANDTALVTEHEIKIDNLLPFTRYYYAIQSGGEILEGDADNFFYTQPMPQTVQPVRVWAIGDAGTNYLEQNQVRDAYYQFTDTTYTNVWLFLGDNAYQSGLDAEYQTNIFTNHYDKLFKQTPVTPAAGNHDLYSANAATQTGPYYDIFSLYTHAEAGGLPSGTEAYYSFNYANIHFVCLESTTASFRTLYSAMYNWLQADLALNKQHWTVVYFHHPPYTKGSHNSDTEVELIEMRQNFAPIFDQYKVDLVLCGHSHTYERSYLLKGHYGDECTFDAQHQVDAGSGEAATPYTKDTANHFDGVVYAVVGCSGKVSSTTANGWPHNAMYMSTNTVLGSMVLDVYGDTLRAKFIDNSVPANIIDEFMLLKHNEVAPSMFIPVLSTVSVYPNPTNNQFILNLNLAQPDEISVDIHAITGQYIGKILDKSLQDAGQQKVTIDLRFLNLPKGTYILKISGKSINQNRLLIIAR